MAVHCHNTPGLPGETLSEITADGGAPMKRRQLLAAASAAALTPIAAFAAGSPIPVQLVEENPALLALGEELPRVEAEYHAACAAWDAMWREWHPQWPLAPDPCVMENCGWPEESERTLTGEPLVRAGRNHSLRVLRLDHLEWRRASSLEALAKDARRKRKSSRETLAYWQSEVDRSELGLALLPGYLAECERIKRESKVEALTKARRAASERVFAFARKVLQEPSSTVAGVRIKAQAAAALGRLSNHDANWGRLMDISQNQGQLVVLLAKAMLDAHPKV